MDREDLEYIRQGKLGTEDEESLDEYMTDRKEVRKNFFNKQMSYYKQMGDMQKDLATKSTQDHEDDFDSVVDFCNSLKFPLKVYRGLLWKDKDEVRLDNLGVHWTIDRDFINRNNFKTILVGEVNEDDVDWKLTQHTYVYYSANKNYPENEIWLKKNAKPHNLEIYSEEEFKSLKESDGGEPWNISQRGYTHYYDGSKESALEKIRNYVGYDVSEEDIDYLKEVAQDEDDEELLGYISYYRKTCESLEEAVKLLDRDSEMRISTNLNDIVAIIDNTKLNNLRYLEYHGVYIIADATKTIHYNMLENAYNAGYIDDDDIHDSLAGGIKDNYKFKDEESDELFALLNCGEAYCLELERYTDKSQLERRSNENRCLLDIDGVKWVAIAVLLTSIEFSDICEEYSIKADESLNEKIVKKGNKWQVQSEKGRNLGTYDTKPEAEKRLKQVHYFKHVNESIDEIDEYTKIINNTKQAKDYLLSQDRTTRITIFERGHGFVDYIFTDAYNKIHINSILDAIRGGYIGNDDLHNIPQCRLIYIPNLKDNGGYSEWDTYTEYVYDNFKLIEVFNAYNRISFKNTSLYSSLDEPNKINEYKNKQLIESLQETDNEGNILSPEQIEFFKNSKVRDEQGRLIVCYHGTDKEFDTFDISHSGTKGANFFGKGHYFTMSSDNDYGKIQKKCYLNITNPMLGGPSWIAYCKKNGKEWYQYPDLTKKLREDGYDGIVSKDSDTAIAFESNQIKSITNKNPTSSNNINEELEEKVLYNFSRQLKENEVLLYHQTSEEKLKEILSSGFIKADVWSQEHIDSWRYGDYAIAFAIDKDKVHKANDTDRIIYKDVPKEDFVSILGMTTRTKTGKDNFRKEFKL